MTIYYVIFWASFLIVAGVYVWAALRLTREPEDVVHRDDHLTIEQASTLYRLLTGENVVDTEVLPADMEGRFFTIDAGGVRLPFAEFCAANGLKLYEAVVRE